MGAISHKCFNCAHIHSKKHKNSVKSTKKNKKIIIFVKRTKSKQYTIKIVVTVKVKPKSFIYIKYISILKFCQSNKIIHMCSA